MGWPKLTTMRRRPQQTFSSRKGQKDEIFDSPISSARHARTRDLRIILSVFARSPVGRRRGVNEEGRGRERAGGVMFEMMANRRSTRGVVTEL